MLMCMGVWVLKLLVLLVRMGMLMGVLVRVRVLELMRVLVRVLRMLLVLRLGMVLLLLLLGVDVVERVGFWDGMFGSAAA